PLPSTPLVRYAALGPLATTRQIKGGGGDHDHAFQDQLHLNGKAQQNHSVEHHDQYEDAEQRAENIAAAAGDLNPAHDSSDDRVEFVALARPLIDLADIADQKQA